MKKKLWKWKESTWKEKELTRRRMKGMEATEREVRDVKESR